MEETSNPNDELSSELRAGPGSQWRDEMAEDEQLTELHRRRSLDLGDQAAAMVNQGLRVSVEFGGHSFGGAVAASGSDYATVNGPGQVADIRLDRSRWSVLPVTGDAPEPPSPLIPESFTAVLHGHAGDKSTIRLALPGGDMVIGTIEVVAKDHVEMRDVDGRRLLVPLSLVLAVVRSLDPH
jgi:hypothetical protein